MFTTEDQQFLDQSVFARLATLMPDGGPQSTVMWYRRDGDTITMVCPADAQKPRNLDRDPRVSLVVEDPESSFKYIEIRGNAEVVRDDPGARRELRRIARRYVGDRADGFVDGLSSDPRVLLVVHPEKINRRGL